MPLGERMDKSDGIQNKKVPMSCAGVDWEMGADVLCKKLIHV